MTTATGSRGARSVLVILTAFDLLTALQGYLFAHVVLTGAAPTETWPWFAWVFGAMVIALPITCVICPLIAWLLPSFAQATRFLWAAAPLGLGGLLWIVTQFVQAGAI